LKQHWIPGQARHDKTAIHDVLPIMTQPLKVEEMVLRWNELPCAGARGTSQINRNPYGLAGRGAKILSSPKKRKIPVLKRDSRTGILLDNVFQNEREDTVYLPLSPEINYGALYSSGGL
jgi:hypothetical protein